MSNKLLDIEPLDLHFNFELKKQISCTQHLTNNTDNYVAFKVKTTKPNKYTVRPNTGVLPPRSCIEVVVTMQAQKEAPADMQCKDKFLLQCFVASPDTEVTAEMFNKEAGNQLEETKLRVIFVGHPPPPVSNDRAARARIKRLTEEKNSAVQLNKKLQQELDQLKHRDNESQSGCGILINIRWYISARGLRRKTVKEGKVAIQI